MNLYCPSISSKSHTATAHIWLFVYGTLKSGQRNHDRYCQGALSITPATTWGRLYALTAGYPALVVPEPLILAHGTADPLANATLQARLAATLDWGENVMRPTGDWNLVHGQLIEFADPLRSLPPIDRLEGFRPGQRSLYQRVLVPVAAQNTVQPCWTYILPGRVGRSRLREGIWPEEE